MLKITIPKGECFDDINQTFLYNKKEVTITLEHSLVSISKWESKWHKPFLADTEKSKEELIDYIRCMNLTQNINDTVFYFLSQDNIKKINEYVGNPMTATTFHDHRLPDSKGPTKKKETLTSELIYYWMIANQIPFECQKWHLNRLLTLIRIANIKNNPETNKMSAREASMSNRALNEARRKAMNSKG